MNGGQDLGGMHGFGPVVEEANEPNFHADWEGRAMALVIAAGACGQWNIDRSRHFRESLPPADYISLPYYRIWTEGLAALLVNAGMATREEIADGTMHQPPKPVAR
ncbi:nitrile hydratase subunit beta, partial [Rhizobiaceae bacterium]|nr:nitrile hydratase subunit beta [Rhizobiaceae bacterium]